VNVLGVIIAIVGLGFLILAHEFGHFIVAKLTGMRVEEFSIGFGRYLVSKRVGETVYGVSVLPLGGYVRVTGMHKEEFEERVAEAREKEAERAALQEAERLAEEQQPRKKKRRPQDPEDRLAGPRTLSADEIAATPLERRYYAHSFFHKLAFIIAGVTMNIVVAFLLLFIVGLYQGQSLVSTTIEVVEPGTPAAAAGMQPGDTVVSIGGKQVSSWEEVRTEILTHPGKTVPLVVQRNGQDVQLSATVREQSDGTGYLGVQPGVTHENLGVAGALRYAGRTTGDMAKLIFVGIKMMFTGQAPVTGSQGLAGPVGIIQLSSEAVRGGYYLSLLALISINLAVLNMLPVLPLDGGHVLFSIIERIRGKSVSLRVFEQVSMIGLIIFVALFILATSNDIGRIIGG
jgi:regulator of sigma E protease